VYSPKVREDLIPRLYRLKIKLNRPMTHLVAEAVEAYLAHHEDQDLMAKSPSQSRSAKSAIPPLELSKQPETSST
jgi:predicted DNA-binding protein